MWFARNFRRVFDLNSACLEFVCTSQQVSRWVYSGCPPLTSVLFTGKSLSLSRGGGGVGLKNQSWRVVKHKNISVVAR